MVGLQYIITLIYLYDMTSNGGSYDDLINEGIDELNEQENFSDTSLTKEKREQKAESFFATKKGYLLLGLLFINLFLYGYYFMQSTDPSSQEEARAEIAATFGEDSPMVQLDSAVSKSYSSATAGKREEVTFTTFGDLFIDSDLSQYLPNANAIKAQGEMQYWEESTNERPVRP